MATEIAVPRVSPREVHRILLPIAGTSNEEAAIDYAALLALALGASITLVHISETPSSMVGIVPGASIEGDLAIERIRATARLDAIAKGLAGRGVTDTQIMHVVDPNVPAALVELATRERFDLVVMATHARTGISRVLLGSVAEHVVRHAPCPVMTIRSP